MPWLYSSLDFFAEEEPYKDRTDELKLWSVNDLRLWLRMRGIQFVSPLKVRLQMQVRELLDQEGGPPQILSVQGGNLKHLRNVIRAFNYMISLLMSNKYYLDKLNSDQIKLSIKGFLSLHAKMDRDFYREEKKRKNQNG